MGYYTSYELSVIPDELEKQVKSSIIEATGYDPFENDCKWYERNDVLQEISKETHALIIIDGRGEESGDVWRAVWLNGKIVMAWEVDTTPPEPSTELVKRVSQDSKAKRIKELEDELNRLKNAIS